MEINAEKKAERWNEGLINSDHQQIYKNKSNYLCLVPEWLLKFKLELVSTNSSLNPLQICPPTDFYLVALK